MTAPWQTHLNRVSELDGMLQFAWTHRAMFGGAMLYADGKPIASLSDVGIGIKLAGADHAALLAVDGAKRLQYGPDQPESKTYILVPADLIDDDDELAHWLNLAAARANRAKPATH
jgi:TfoX/Sxy family transcriptional regulator of competence genes